MSADNFNSDWEHRPGAEPPGLKDWNPGGKAPPRGWRTDNYHPISKEIQERNERMRARLEEAGISSYVNGEKIEFTFISPNWRLRHDYDGRLGVALFHYQSLEEARGMEPEGRHSWRSRFTERNSVTPNELISQTPRLVERGGVGWNQKVERNKREWTLFRRALSGNPDFPECTVLNNMLEDENTEEYKALQEMYRESCSHGGKNCAVEYARLRDNENRSEADEAKWTRMFWVIRYVELCWNGGRVRGGEDGGEMLRGIKKNVGVTWSSKEDELLKALIRDSQSDSWVNLAKRFPGKNAAHLQTRWNAIRPGRSLSAWTDDEDARLLAYASEARGNTIHGTNFLPSPQKVIRKVLE
ncbi:hypothetical protein THAOC_35107 [Thalassiosira oceanica]|uniref:Myb-like domain-containing protein n=1 Tax=Thalassiosira oceanica TaxID=159749 RepID=K0R2E9_THAOC|nr:hypothetical protein THAOC_35107 [Thalassiosira oceanica]|eukprot:EJK46240.1 hypothetical protein THAOC_35107 [Thalassiosira oceanica]